MSQLLYRLGIFAARRAWAVILVWLAILGVAVGAAATAGGTFTTAMTIEGVPAQKTIDKLAASFPDASRGVGQVIFHTANGKPFTEAEKAAITRALNTVGSMNAVSEAIDPFDAQRALNDQRDELNQAPDDIAAAQAKIDKGRADVADGRAKLADGLTEITANVKKLVAAEKDLKAGEATLLANESNLLGFQAHLSAGIAELEGYGDAAPADQLAALRAQLAEVEAGLQQVAAGKAEITAGRDEIARGWWLIESGRRDIAAGTAELDAAEVSLNEGQAELDEQAAKLAPAQSLIAAATEFRLVSADGATAIGTVLFETPITEVETADRTWVADALTKLDGASDNPNIRVEVSQDLLRSLDSLLGVGEIVGLVVAAVTLFVMLGTLIGAGLPVLAALIGVGISAAITFALSAVFEFTSTTPILGVMLGLAVGIDYALFILNRHRRQLKTGMTVRDSIALANGTSGNSVVFAGLTVMIALAALNLTGIGFLGVMGTMGAMAIVFSVLIAITLTPALLSRIGTRVLSRKERSVLSASGSNSTASEVSTKSVFATRRPWITVVATILILGIASIPFGSIRLGLPDGSSEPIESAGYQSYKLTEEAFGEGVNGALIVVVDAPEAVSEESEVDFQATIANAIMSVDNVQAAIPSGFSDDRTSMVFRVIPNEGPNAVSTATVVTDLRALDAQLADSVDAHIEVTGIAAVNIDVSKKLGEALPLYLLTVIGLSLVLMVLVFRSIAVPIVASLGFLLTVFATLGATVAVFQWGWLGQLFDIHDPAPILSFLPTILIGILFGLAMDYQLFLASGMREAYVHGKTAKESINFGIHLSRAVVVAAAIIMISVFGGFIFSHTTMIRPVGFGLAIGVLIDAFIVRLLLVPATLTLLGNAAWWIPKWLDRILPDVDVEGAKLEGKLAN